MRCRWTVWAPSAACLLLLFPCLTSGQQGTQLYWQGAQPPSSHLQSLSPPDSSQKPAFRKGQQPALPPQQPPPSGAEQVLQESNQPVELGVQEAPTPSAQMEIPARWQPEEPPVVSMPGYLGLSGRDFYRERFCMHALTIQGVEIVTVAPGSPAMRAGLRPAHPLSAREAVVATAAGLLTVSPAASLAPSFVRAAGGVDHGDIILAVGGKRVKTKDQFESALARFGPHTVVYLTVRRGEVIVQIPVRLAEWPDSAAVSSLQQAKASEGR